MPTLRTVTPALFLSSALLGCSAMEDREPFLANGPSATGPADVDRLLGERLNAGDVDGVVALYEPTAVLLHEDGTAVVGQEAIRKAYEPLAAGKPTIDMGSYRVVTSDDLATVSHDWSAVATGADGKRVSATGAASEVVRRQPDGTWRFVIDDPYARSRHR
jgi:uncharacterized protein (TIGR02246 family)